MWKYFSHIALTYGRESLFVLFYAFLLLMLAPSKNLWAVWITPMTNGKALISNSRAPVPRFEILTKTPTSEQAKKPWRSANRERVIKKSKQEINSRSVYLRGDNDQKSSPARECCARWDRQTCLLRQLELRISHESRGFLFSKFFSAKVRSDKFASRALFTRLLS